jgi:hypothetical protein
MSGSPAFQSTGFQTGKKGGSDTPAFQGDPSTFTVDAGSSISGGTWTKGKWRKFVGEIEAEAKAKLDAKLAKERAEREAAKRKVEAERAKREAERQARRQEAERVAAEQRAALVSAHAIAAQESARQMMQQLETLHLTNTARQAALEKARQEDDEAALMLLLHMDH